MLVLQSKIDNYIQTKKMSLPSTRGSFQGLSERLKKVQTLLPQVEKDMNQILNEHLNGKELTVLERQEVTTIFQKAIKNFIQ